MFAVIGILVVFGAIVSGYLMEHGNIRVLPQPAELIIIGGAAAGTVLVANPLHILKKIAIGMAGVFGGSKFTKSTYLETLKTLYDLLNKARKEGLMSLEGDVEEPDKSPILSKSPKVLKDHHARDFVCDTLRMAITGVDSFELDQMLDLDLDLEADLCSDTRSVFPLVNALAHTAGPGIRWMRDPTRGGVATALNELARDCGLGIALFEDRLPARDAVRGACELLGLDPLHIANEGQFIAVVAPEILSTALDALHKTPGGEEAVMIGEVTEQPSGSVLVTTRYGGTRIVDMLVGDPLQRIC